VIDELKDFIEFNPREFEFKAAKAPSVVFQNMGEKQALRTFVIASKIVPAYKDFLKKNKINPEKIKKIEDFRKVPLTNKKNYLKKYPLKDLQIEGNYVGKSAITSSSGSTGEPLFWPRFPAQDFGATKGFDSFLTNALDIDKIPTFHVNCSGMGVWTSGDYISILNKYLSYKYPHNSSISPGIDIENTIKVLENISPDFKQTIIYSYPPFAKDIIDNTPPRLIKKYNLRLVVYGEPYTEKWRTYILKKIDVSRKKPYYVTSVLGSSEGGLIGIESRACTLIRVIASKNKALCKSLFGESRIPSLVQFNPMSKMIEIVDNNIVLTSMGGLPLIRYNTHDFGDLLTKENIIDHFKKFSNINFESEARAIQALITALPYLFVFGRSDYTASIYGVLIYPETIKDILSSNPFLKYFSGRFIMSTEEDAGSNQYLSLILETKKTVDVKDVAIPIIEKSFAEYIKLYSSEYSKLLSSAGQRVYPKISIRNYGDQEHFSGKNKQRYLI
jgi:phenylacetate-CoA ligase